MGATLTRTTSPRPATRLPLGRRAASGRGERKSGREERAFRPDVEGLRAVAILLVVLYHTHVPGISGGYVGVDVFFVISGFLITGQLVRELRKERRISFAAFYARRARRILPAATLVTMVTAVASALLLNPLAAQRALHDGLAAIYFGANFHLAVQGANYFNAGLPPSPVQHYWSLSVEEQFYIVWPMLLVLSSLVWLGTRRQPSAGSDDAQRPPGSRRRRPVIALVILVLAGVAALSLRTSISQTATSPSWAYYSIFTRAWELSAGALLALALPFTQRLDRRLALPLTWMGLVCIAIASVAFSDSTPYPGDFAVLPVLGATAVIAGGAASGRWGAEALLGTAPFQRVGRWSYSWYLWHWPALILAAALLAHSLTTPQALAVDAVSLTFAVMSFVLVERPIRRIQVVVQRPKLGLACAAALAASAIAVVSLASLIVAPLRPPGAAVAITPLASKPTMTRSVAADKLTAARLTADLIAGVNTRRVPSNLQPALQTAAGALPLIVKNGCHLQHTEVRSKPCVYGDTNSPISVVLFGDSHAAAWFPALDLISNQQHWRLVDLTKAGCPPAEVDILLSGVTPYPSCAQWRRNAQAQIAAIHPALVIMAWARFIEVPEARPLAGKPTGYGSIWQNGLAAIFEFLRRTASHVIFISDTPTLAQLAPDCVAGNLSDVFPCTVKRTAAVRLPVVKREELQLARREQIHAIDPTAWFCAPTRCPVIVGNILVYRDNAHMTPAWSRFIAPVLAERILSIIRSAQPASPSGVHRQQHAFISSATRVGGGG